MLHMKTRPISIALWRLISKFGLKLGVTYKHFNKHLVLYPMQSLQAESLQIAMNAINIISVQLYNMELTLNTLSLFSTSPAKTSMTSQPANCFRSSERTRMMSVSKTFRLDGEPTFFRHCLKSSLRCGYYSFSKRRVEQCWLVAYLQLWKADIRWKRVENKYQALFVHVNRE